jgi:L-ascorbate metabolism protein UlaG (beta-lactamase superfamily)
LADIQYFGHSCFRLRGRDGIVLCDPYDTSIGFDIGHPTAHIVTISHDHPGHNNAQVVRPVRDSVFVIDGPGEYEVKGVLITGVRTYHDSHQGATYGVNTVYIMHLDDVVFCHLGDVAHELSQQQLEEIGNVDVLFVPVGGDKTADPSESTGLISQIEPRIVIPMHYAMNGQSLLRDLAPLEKFTHEIGLKDIQPQEKLSISASSLPPEGSEMRVIVMQPVINP